MGSSNWPRMCNPFLPGTCLWGLQPPTDFGTVLTPSPGGLGAIGDRCRVVGGGPGGVSCCGGGSSVGGPGIVPRFPSGAGVDGGCGAAAQDAIGAGVELPCSEVALVGVCNSKPAGLGAVEPQSGGLNAVSSGAGALKWSGGLALDLVDVTEECRGE